ncbi:PAS domain-containing protein [Hymenobacter nivis]|uniref:histidine kinase n=1 Tax=Hymenobacter nivis TaxID=1850093 RepID=A0A502HF04_9BACT|nr:PAS domain-containing protein [Hymenobacter nivis]TPG72063.1 PAS domain S-box protein [Hymenobacter nivis]
MPHPTLAGPLAADAAPEELLHTLLEVALTGFILFRPVYAAAGAEIVDLAYEYLNPAAQQLLRLPQCPPESFLTRFPKAGPAGIFAFYRDAFLSGETQREAFNFQHDGLDGYFHLVARRQGPRLVVSFLDTDAPLPGAQAQALRQSQAREQAALAEAERQRGELQRVFEQAPVAVAVYRGPQYIIELANPTVCRLWGRTPAQLLGKGLFEALPEVAGMGYEALLDGVMATGVPHVAQAMEAQHDRNGQRETVFWDFVYVPLYEADGRIYGAMVVATEVTEQVLARRQLQQLNEELELRVTARSAEAHTALFEVERQREQLRMQQRLLSQILGQVPAAIATLSGPEHRFSFFNDQYQAIVAGRAALGRTAAEAMPEVQEQGFIALLDQVYATGQPFVGTETSIMLHDPATGRAELRYVDFIYQPLFDGQQHPQGILAFIIDVTDRVRARKQTDTLQAAMLAVVQRQAQQRQELFQIFEQTPVAIVLLREPDHRIDYFNPAFEELFPPEVWAGPLQGHTLAEVYPRIKLAGLVELMDRVYATGESQVVLDMPLEKLQPGSPRYVTFAYQAYREQGRITGVAAFVYDVTDQVLARHQVLALNEELAASNEKMRATNAALHTTNAQLTRTNADLDTFVYSASHDLKSPITNIEGLLGALREHLPPNALQEPLVPRLLDMMGGAVARFQQTLGHLTDISRLQEATLHQPAEAIDLPALVEAVRLDILPELAAAGATLAVDLAACPTVHFSAKNLRSIIYNLLSNAVKYGAPGRPTAVLLRGYRLAGQVVLAVHDNGLGLSQVQQGELFRMFRRLHSHVPGSGVGLYMVKKMVENAGGTIAVHSELGVGSTFTVSLPQAG